MLHDSPMFAGESKLPAYSGALSKVDTVGTTVRITKVSVFLGASSILPVGIVMCTPSDGQVCHQRLSSAYDLLLIFLCSLIQTLTLTLTPLPNDALLANMETCECTLGL